MREQRAVAADEREVRLRVAAVHCEDHGLTHRAAPASDRGSSARRLSEELTRELVLPDQRVREERLPRRDRVARHRRLGRQPLVGRDVLDEAEELGRERRLRERLGADRPDPRGKLDDVVVLQPLDDAVVPHVDDLHVAGPGRERRDERGRRLAVERPARCSSSTGFSATSASR